MKVISTSILVFLISISIFSQTKNIAFKSHSGSEVNFSKAIVAENTDIKNSNFGIAPNSVIKYAKLDSLIYINEDTVVMVTSNYCINRFQSEAEEEIWKAGRDTVYQHQDFSRNESLDTIKKILKEQYNFANPVDSIYFEGYEENTLTKSKPIIKASKAGIPSGSYWLLAFGALSMIWMGFWIRK